MSNDTVTAWNWMTNEGELARVRPVSIDLSEWYADDPGQRPPQGYEITIGATIHQTTVSPYEPWSAADALSDHLHAQGWTDLDAVEPDECEHGLSADLCSGPAHY